MIWQSAAEFWAMGGYAVYVWGSLGMSAAVLVLEIVLTRQGRQQALNTVCEARESDPQSASRSTGQAWDMGQGPTP